MTDLQMLREMEFVRDCLSELVSDKHIRDLLRKYHGRVLDAHATAHRACERAYAEMEREGDEADHAPPL